MKKYVSRCTILKSGAKVEHTKTFKWNERKIREQIKLMDGVGTVDTIPEQTFSFDYVIPKNGAILDWSIIEDETITVFLKSGQRITFTGVDLISQGELSFDGEKESVMSISCGYDDFVIE